MIPLARARRKGTEIAGGSLVETRPLFEGSVLPLLVEPAIAGVGLIEWVAHNRVMVESLLLKRGGILFRDFEVDSVEEFEEFLHTISLDTLEYRERSSPRTQVAGNIYTSTEYPADQHTFLHNENSYAHTWPLKIAFHCRTAPLEGGETPIADCRRIYERIDAAVRQKFATRGVMYVRNLGRGMGLSWETVFQTNKKSAVEAYCERTGYKVEWTADGRLRTRRVGPAVSERPHTGEKIWFNHAAFFHISTLPSAVRQTLLAQYAEEDLLNNTYYGDGSPIETEVLDGLRVADNAEAVMFRWQQGDLLLLDNMLVAQGRSPFKGPRQILTGMAEPYSCPWPRPDEGREHAS